MDILKRTHMVEARPVSSLMYTSTHLLGFEGEVFNDPTLFRSTLGALQY